MTNSDFMCQHMQILADWLAASDVFKIDKEEMAKHPAPDAIVLFGGSPLEGAYTAALAKEAWPESRLILVGGYGHTTSTLMENMSQVLKAEPEPPVSEASLFNQYLKEQFDLKADELETKSTNCGNNVTYLLELLKEKMPECKRLAIIQDPSMQRRMKAVFELQDPEMELISIPAFLPKFVVENNGIQLKSDIRGQWSLERFVQLLCSEIPRLKDDENGYGPKGKGFISHVEIPYKVLRAWKQIMDSDYGSLRQADRSFASK